MDTHETGDGKVMIILQYFNKIWTWWQDPLRALFPVPGTLVTLQSVILGEQIAVINSQDISCKLFIFVFCFWRFCLLNCFFLLAVQAGSADLVLERLREMSHCPLSTVRPDVNLKSKPVLRRGPAGEDANSRKSLFEVPIIDLNKTLLSLCW